MTSRKDFAGRPDSRIRALIAFTPRLPPTDRAQILAKALDNAASHWRDIYRANALGDLARYLTPDLLTKALDIAAGLTIDYARAEALGHLAPYLPLSLLGQGL